MTSVRQVDSFGVVLPEQWTSVPTELHAFEQFCNRARERWRQSPLFDRAFERRVDTMLNRLRHELASAGVILAAVFIEEVVDDTVEPGQAPNQPELLIAACTLAIYSKADLETQLSLSVPVLFSAFTRKPRNDEARFGRITDVVRPEVTELPAGRAVHLRRLYEPRRFGMELENFFAESFVLPVGTDGEACCVLQFATTNVEQSRRFSELFGAIAATFRVFRPTSRPSSSDDRHPIWVVTASTVDLGGRSRRFETVTAQMWRGDVPIDLAIVRAYRRSHLAPAGHPAPKGATPMAILLEPDEARSHADDVRTTADNLGSDINSLKSRLSALSGSFTGETATRWQDKFDEVSTQGNELMEAIGAIGDFLKQAADTLEQTDQELASNL